MKRFQKNDDSFICENCGAVVPKLKVTSRDHCPNCLYSKHVDIYPGDRKETCHGLLKPVGIERFKDTYKILYECEKCGYKHKNVMASDDNFDKIIELSQNNKPI